MTPGTTGTCRQGMRQPTPGNYQHFWPGILGAAFLARHFWCFRVRLPVYRMGSRVSQSSADTGAGGAGEAATDWAENTRITPQEPASRADLIVRRLSPDRQTAPTILKVIQE